MARLAGVLGRDDRPIAFTDQLPLCFRGGADPIPNLAMANVGKPIDARQAKLIETMYAGQHIGASDLGRSVTEGFAVRDTVFHTLDEEMKAASRGAVSARGFELSAQRIGVLMRQQFNLAFVDVGGWDTHVNQGQCDWLSGRPDRRAGTRAGGVRGLDRARGMADDDGRRGVRIRAHLPREWRQGHRPRPWQRLFG